MECLPQGISFDGSVIVGNFSISSTGSAAQYQYRVFRWTVEKGIEFLETLKGGKESFAQGVSNDGSVIVGYAQDGAAQNQLRAFRWTAEKGIESVEKLLADKGALPPGWVLTHANALTLSGTMFVGSGDYTVQRVNGKSKTLTRTWRVVIPFNNINLY